VLLYLCFRFILLRNKFNLQLHILCAGDKNCIHVECFLIICIYKKFLQILRPLLQSNSKFVVMGDFNTLSRHDRRYRILCTADVLVLLFYAHVENRGFGA